MIFTVSGSASISIPEVMQLLLDSQGKRQPTYQDVVSLLAFNRWSAKQDLMKVKGDMMAIKSDIRSEFSLIKKEARDMAVIKKDLDEEARDIAVIKKDFDVALGQIDIDIKRPASDRHSHSTWNG